MLSVHSHMNYWIIAITSMSLWSCEQNTTVKIVSTNTQKTFIENSSLNISELDRAKILITTLQLSEGFEILNDQLTKCPSEKESTYIKTFIKELTSEFPELKDLYPNDLKLSHDNEGIQFYSKLRHNYKSINISELKRTKSLCNNKDQYSQHLSKLATYYTYVDHNVDSVNHFLQLISGSLSEFEKLTIHHYRYWFLKITHLTYTRNNIHAIAFINDVLAKLDDSIDPLIISSLIEERAYMSLRIGQMPDAITDIRRLLQTYDNHPCSHFYHRAKKLELYYYIYTKELKEFEETFEEYQLVTQKCKSRPIIKEQIKGRYFVINNNMDSALHYLNIAARNSTLIDRTNIQVKRSINYMLSEAYQKKGMYDEAISVYAQNISDEEYEDNISTYLKKQSGHNYDYVHHIRVSSILYDKWKHEGSKESLQQAVTFANRALEQSTLSFQSIEENTLLRLMGYHDDIHKILMAANYDLYVITAEEKYKVNSWRHASSRKNLLLQRDIIKNQEDRIIYTKLSQQKIALNSQIKSIQNKSNLDNVSLSSISNRLISLEENINNTLKEHGPIAYAIDQIDPTSLQNNLSRNQSLLHIAIYDDCIYQYHIAKNSINVSTSKADISLYSLIEDYQDIIHNPNTSLSNYKENSISIFNQIIGPTLYADLKDSIIVILDNAFTPINIENLIIDTSGNHFKDLRYLIKHKEISYSMNERLLRSSKVSTSPERQSEIAGFSFTDNNTELSHNTRLEELSGALKEIEFLKLKYNSGTYYTGCDLTKINLIKELTNRKTDILHIATHGVSSSTTRDDVKLYLRSKDCTLDSIYGFELINYDLNDKEINLSSCESNVGVSSNTEEAYNLTRYFVLAGARKVISSKWKVNDQAVAILFNHYYDLNSLRKAKLKTFQNPDISHPYYWSHLIEYR